MKIKTSSLTTALNHLKPVVGRKTSSLPILSCVHLSSDNNTLTIQGSDLDQHQIERVDCEGDFEPCCINFNALLNVIGGEEMTLTQNKESILFKCSYGTATIGKLDAEEFPATPKFDKPKKIGVACVDLADSIGRVTWAAFPDESRYILHSVHIRATSKMLTCEATNGRNLAVINLPSISADFEVIAPEQFSMNLSSALSRDGSVLSVSEKHIIVEHASGMYCTKQIEGVYPNTKQVVPAKPELIGEASVAELVEGFSRCNFFADPSRTPSAKLEFGKDGLDVSFSGKNSQLEISVAGSFKKQTVIMDAQSFLTCLKGLKSNTVKILMGGEIVILESGNLSIYSTQVRAA
jgi:DNA polymerase-3 subunit beta